MKLNFREWFLLIEGINYLQLINKWKRIHPEVNDAIIKQQIDTIAQADPSSNKQYTNWLVNQVLNNRLRLPEDKGIIEPDLRIFDDFKKRKLIKGDEANIDKYDRTQFHILVDRLKEKNIKSKRQEKIEMKSGAEKLYQDETWMIIKATTEEACIAYGKGTKWCTAALKNNMANEYLAKGPIYIIYKEGKPYAQVHSQSKQFMDIYDNEIEPNTFPDDLAEILHEVLPKNTFDDHLFLSQYTDRLDLDKIEKKHMEEITSDPKKSFEYAKMLRFKNLPLKIIQTMAKDPKVSYEYAVDVLHYNNVPEEIIKGIANDAYCSNRYAMGFNLEYDSPPEEIIKGISKDSYESYNYAMRLRFQNVPEEIIKGISQSPFRSLEFAKVLKFKNIHEEIIKGVSQDVTDSLEYAKHLNYKNVPEEIIKGITKDPNYAYWFAQRSNFENVPEEILNAITNNFVLTNNYKIEAKRRGLDIPQIILNSGR